MQFQLNSDKYFGEERGGKMSRKFFENDFKMLCNCPVLYFEVQTRGVYAFRDNNKGASL